MRKNHTFDNTLPHRFFNSKFSTLFQSSMRSHQTKNTYESNLIFALFPKITLPLDREIMRNHTKNRTNWIQVPASTYIMNFAIDCQSLVLNILQIKWQTEPAISTIQPAKQIESLAKANAHRTNTHTLIQWD